MADPKNKWTRPAAPPAPMFFGEKERNLVKQVNDELAERVLGQTIAYYPISIEESNFNDIYGEAKEKVSLPPVRVFAYVEVENEQSNERYGYEYQTKLTVNFHRRRLVEDQDLYVRVGDFVQYGEIFYEIVKLYNDTRFLFGQVEHKFQVSAECVRARQGVFRVMPGIDRPAVKDQKDSGASNPAPRAAPYPPLNATYITVASEAKLPNERVLTGGTGIEITDGGSGGGITITATSQNATGPTGSIQIQKGSGAFTGSANLTFLTSSGFLGIGTDAPSHALTVVGAVSASANSFYAGNVAVAGKVGVGTTSPSHELAVIGSVSASADVMVAGDLTVKGILVGGSPLKIAGAIEIHDTANGNGVIASMGDVDGSGDTSISASCLLAGDITASLAYLPNIVSTTQISASTILADTSLWHNITCSSFMSSSLYYGDGRHLVNVARAQGSMGDLQYYFSDDGKISGSSNLRYLTSSNTLSVVGTVSASSNVSATYFYGDGRYLTNVTASAIEVADGPVGSLQFRFDSPIGREISGSSNVAYDTSNNRVTINSGLVHNRVPVSASHTASSANYILGVTHVPSSILFDASTFTAGQVLLVKDESGAAASNKAITLNPAGSQKIDGAPSVILESPYGSVLVYTDGSNWFIY